MNQKFAFPYVDVFNNKLNLWRSERKTSDGTIFDIIGERVGNKYDGYVTYYRIYAIRLEFETMDQAKLNLDKILIKMNYTILSYEQYELYKVLL